MQAKHDGDPTASPDIIGETEGFVDLRDFVRR
jgi:hypothetical protein